MALCLALPTAAWAEWQARAFAGITFAGATTFNDPEQGAGNSYLVLGASGGWLGEVFGIEGDFARAAAFFETDDRDLLLDGGVRTLTGNVVIALPRRMAQYTLRPYFVGGAGLMHVRLQAKLGLPPQVSRTLPALNLGGGVTGYFNDRLGVNWEARHVRSLDRAGQELRGDSLDEEQLSFWRLTMSVALRY